MGKMKKTGALVLICLLALQLVTATVGTMRSNDPIAEPVTESAAETTAENRQTPSDQERIPAQTLPASDTEQTVPQEIPQITPPTVPEEDPSDAPDTTEEIRVGGYESGHADSDEDPIADPTEPVPTETEPIPTAPATETVDNTSAQAPAAAPASNEGQGGLYDIADPDPNYVYRVVKVTGSDRQLLEALVMGEAGDQGFIGAAMVAQCIKDAMVYEGYKTVAEVRTKLKYTGSISRKPNQDVIKAVAYIFDEGGYAVQHPILYFYYSAKGIKKGFHETQEFVVEYKDHRFFWKK